MGSPINHAAEERLNTILQKDLNDLTESDKAFLRARRSYIGKRSQDRLKHVFNEKDPEPVNTDTTVVTDADPVTSDHPGNQPSDDGDDE